MANMKDVVLDGAYLNEANLDKARGLSDLQLAKAASLKGAYMQDGKLYDGRYNLEGDLLESIKLGVKSGSPLSMAKFYGVAVDEYLKGQAWADEHLSAVEVINHSVDDSE